jgi:PAS domain S-box-containing protein
LVIGLSVCVVVLLRSLKKDPLENTDLENELLRTNTRLMRISQAIENASDAIGIGDMNGNSIYHNQAHMALFGYTVTELNAVPGGGVLFADLAVANEIHLSIRAGRSWSGETDILTRSGARIPAFVRADLIFDSDRQPIGIFGVFTDITERRRIESSLDAERQRLAITLQSIGDGVITTSASGQIDLMNRVAAQLTGWTQEEAHFQPVARLFSLVDETTRRPLELVTSGMDTRSLSATGLLVTRGGQELVIAATVTPISGSFGKVIVFRDITTERRQALERERANKVESLGMMAGGIAHDFANVLTAIMAHLSMAQAGEPLPPAVAVSLKEATRASWKARDLTQQLLTFARGGVPTKIPVQVDGIIRESVTLSLHSAPGVNLQYHFPPDLWPALADVGQLGQIFNNLVINAAQAMGDRGSITITGRNLPPGPEQGPALAAKSVVYLSVADNGPGIPAEHLSKIFDPFFSTKSTGTGLGLATVFSIVNKHGGRIHVDSIVGRGTRFHLYLPAAREESPLQFKLGAA